MDVRNTAREWQIWLYSSSTDKNIGSSAFFKAQYTCKSKTNLVNHTNLAISANYLGTKILLLAEAASLIE